MIGDLFDGSEAVKMLSNLVIIITASPIVGPLVGGAILEV